MPPADQIQQQEQQVRGQVANNSQEAYTFQYVLQLNVDGMSEVAQLVIHSIAQRHKICNNSKQSKIMHTTGSSLQQLQPLQSEKCISNNILLSSIKHVQINNKMKHAKRPQFLCSMSHDRQKTVNTFTVDEFRQNIRFYAHVKWRPDFSTFKQIRMIANLTTAKQHFWLALQKHITLIHQFFTDTPCCSA